MIMKVYKMLSLHRVLFLFLFFTSCLSLPCMADPAAQHHNTENNIGLKGYDPVSYFNDGPVKGKPKYSASFQDIRYLFASEKNLHAFEQNPARYLPAYGGWCAWAMRDGEKVDINPKRFKIVNGVNYLFYDGFWGDTLKKWNKLSQKTTEQQLIDLAQEQWQEIFEH